VTASQDLEGEVLERRPTEALDPEALYAATPRFVGDIEQIPPMVSALKVGGQRLHRLARQGLTVERAPRPVRVVAWDWLEVGLPEASFRIRCTAGTYVRTLIHDLGLALGTGAALASLRRTRSEPFGLERAVSLADLDHLTIEQALAAAAIPLDQALEVIPEVVLDERAALEIGAGGRPRVARSRAPLGAGPRSVVMRGPTAGAGARRARRHRGYRRRAGLPARGVPVGGARRPAIERRDRRVGSAVGAPRVSPATSRLTGNPIRESGPTVLAVGIFDGLHLGHRAILERAVARARAVGGRNVVVSFDPHPDVVLKPGRFAYVAQLTPLTEKRARLRRWGSTSCASSRSRVSCLRSSPRAFCTEHLVWPYRPIALVVERISRWAGGAPARSSACAESARAWASRSRRSRSSISTASA
jgi:hypothetical protein